MVYFSRPAKKIIFQIYKTEKVLKVMKKHIYKSFSILYEWRFSWLRKVQFEIYKLTAVVVNNISNVFGKQKESFTVNYGIIFYR